MKTIIIYISYHHQNTKKVAERIAPILEAKLITPEEFRIDEANIISQMNECYFVGFGSGIYVGKHHKDLLELVNQLPDFVGQKAFIFSTCGGDEKLIDANHAKLRELVLEKKFEILGEFSCKGWDSVGPLKLIGGIHKDRPNEQDLQEAEKFAREIREKNPYFINGNGNV